MRAARIGFLAAALALISAAANPVVPTASVPVNTTLSGLDAHDGMIVQAGATYYLYGTRYGCGFQWRLAGTPFCGFGVWTSIDKATWLFQNLLFDPSSINTYRSESWQVTCGYQGLGCFNPRMAQRPDGVWIFWFNAPGDYARTATNAYYAMGCAGPLGPCGPGAGPHGSLNKPHASKCYGDGDFSLFNDVDGREYIVCTMPGPNQTFSLEQLDTWWTNGDDIGLTLVAQLGQVEAPAIFRDPASGIYFLTFADVNCGFCSATGTSYATATRVLGTWSSPANVGDHAPYNARRMISAASCGGQPRSVSWLDGQPVEWIDLWYGAANETNASLHLETLRLDATASLKPNGSLWLGQILPLGCT